MTFSDTEQLKIGTAVETAQDLKSWFMVEAKIKIQYDVLCAGEIVNYN